ncbi:sodium:calcium antiporter [Chitinophaga japonensis]|uniref:Cation:H+ antiporter n=1 Tax=Chitinophaga japonensis TaxID=104662 RepID=A0A562T069_CHIJA|nr:sodium:calcium antiporter [Chitinophaga japonensis]TWI86400.1 cation:H+ antiporter [Chitinophaga japonensis]
MLPDLLLFSACAVVIFIAGRKLSYYGNLIAIKTGIGKAWIGLVLVAAVTSLPELVVGIGSVTIVKSADLALGDIAGSCAFNLLLLSLLDFMSPKPLLGRAANTHVLAASMSILLLAIVGIGLFLPVDISIAGWLSAVSLLAFIVYFITIRLLFNYEKRNHHTEAEVAATGMPLRVAVRYYIFNSLFIVAAAIMLPTFAEGIALKSGLGLTFVGTLFLAASTSLPEVAVSGSALRAGNVDIAVGNILGSNIFNIFILALDDLFYAGGSLLFNASDINLVSIFAAIMMTTVAIAGLMIKLPEKGFLLTWDTFVILLIFLFNLLLLYWLKA